ncbi:hypothetical protein [Mesorhizobium sp. M0767]|uniref:hypothetical protein n=1 Tax=Mesorhizobium sp. M0767 TaxID=2956995 RepID=UPI003339680C
MTGTTPDPPSLPSPLPEMAVGQQDGSRSGATAKRSLGDIDNSIPDIWLPPQSIADGAKAEFGAAAVVAQGMQIMRGRTNKIEANSVLAPVRGALKACDEKLAKREACGTGASTWCSSLRPTSLIRSLLSAVGF